MNKPQELHPELLHLQEQANKLVYPAGNMINGTAAIPGPGFFPAAWGSMDPALAISSRPIMVLGQDQDNVRGLDQSRKKGYETYSSTWRNLLKLFTEAGLDPDACFYTNFILGVRQNSDRNTGPSPALAYPAFMQACADMFLEQLQLQQPRLIITLGMVPFKLLSLVSADMRYRALGIEEFKDLDARELHINANVAFDDARRTTTTVVSLCHPCQPLNGQRRSFPHTDLYSSEAAMLMCATDTYAPSAALKGVLRKVQAYRRFEPPVGVS